MFGKDEQVGRSQRGIEFKQHRRNDAAMARVKRKRTGAGHQGAGPLDDLPAQRRKPRSIDNGYRQPWPPCLIFPVAFRRDDQRADGRLLCLPKPKDDIRLIHGLLCPGDTLRLDAVITFAQSRRINEEQRKPVEHHRRFDAITCRPRDIRNDRCVPINQRIEKAGFSGIGRTSEDNADAVMKPFCRRLVKQRSHRLSQRRKPRQVVGRRLPDIAFIGKIESGLDRRGFAQQLRLPCLDPAPHLSTCQQKSSGTLGFGFGRQKIGQALCFGKIDPPVFEGAAGEFTRLRGAKPIQLS